MVFKLGELLDSHCSFSILCGWLS